MNAKHVIVRFGPLEPLDPEGKYQLSITERSGFTLFQSCYHPITGKDLNARTCLEVVDYYLPPKQDESKASTRQLRINGRTKRLVKTLNSSFRQEIEEAHRVAVVNGFDYALPATDRVTWRNMASFLQSEAERY